MDYWKIKFEPIAKKQLKKLDSNTAKLIQSYVNTKILSNPRSKGKALSGNKKGLWRYRVDKYRIICRIQDDRLIVLVLTLGKRDEIYDH